MDIDSEPRVAILRNEHFVVAGEVRKLLQSPSIDSLAVQGLKRKKLYLKDTLTQIGGATRKSR